MTEFNFQSLNFILPFLSLILSAVAIIIGLNCIWRVEKKLDWFLKLLTGATLVTAVRKSIGLVGLDQSGRWPEFLLYFDLIASILLLFAFLEMYRIIRQLSNENKNRV